MVKSIKKNRTGKVCLRPYTHVLIAFGGAAKWPWVHDVQRQAFCCRRAVELLGSELVFWRLAEAIYSVTRTPDQPALAVAGCPWVAVKLDAYGLRRFIFPRRGPGLRGDTRSVAAATYGLRGT